MALKLTFDQIDLLKRISKNERSFELEEIEEGGAIESFQNQFNDLRTLESLSLIELDSPGNVEIPTNNSLIKNIQVKRITESGEIALRSFLDENYKIEV